MLICALCDVEANPCLLVPIRGADGSFRLTTVCEPCAIERGVACLMHGSKSVAHTQFGNRIICLECRNVMRTALVPLAPMVSQRLREAIIPVHLVVLMDWATDSCNFGNPTDDVLLGAIIDYSLTHGLGVYRALDEICERKSAYVLLPPAWQGEIDRLPVDPNLDRVTLKRKAAPWDHD